ncbi:MAG: polysaccharide biosynthesis C-terminal domain-containing protein [Actinomycetes bacterium]|nr:polysaccharide biosynthesis C-terminal domain-containing protein [Actinomycetes bacterium]
MKNTAANSIAQAVVMLVGFFVLPLLIRGFGVAAYGTYVLAVSVSSWAGLLDLGLPATVVRRVAAAQAVGALGQLRATLRSAGVLYAALGLALTAVVAGLAFAAGAIFRVTPGEALTLRWLLLLTAGAQLLLWPTALCRDALSGLQRYDLVSALVIVGAVVDVAGVAVVLASGRGPVLLVAIRLFGQALVFAMGALFVLRVGAAGEGCARGGTRVAGAERTAVATAERTAVAERTAAATAERTATTTTMAATTAVSTSPAALLREARPQFILQVSGLLSKQQTAKLIVGIILGTAAATLFDVAAKFNSLLSTFSSLSTSAATPVIAELNALERHDSLRALLISGSRAVTALVTPVTCVLLLLTGPLIRTWLGPSFAAAIPITLLLLSAQAAVPLYQMGDPVLIGKNRLRRWARSAVCIALLNLALAWLGVRLFGAVGAGLAALICGAIELPWYMLIVRRETGVSLRRWLAAGIWPAIPLLALPILLCLLARLTPLTDSLPGLVTVAATAIAAYWLVFWRVGLKGWERSLLWNSLRHGSDSAENGQHG